MSAPAPLSDPGVHVPPPFIYAGGILAGWLLNRWVPLPISATSETRHFFSGMCFAFWLGLMLAAFESFRRAGTTFLPNRPATALVTSGPYRLTRNPMYLSMALLYVGVTLFLNSWWMVLLFPVVILVIDRIVIAREERYLEHAFPGAYTAYRARVRRWI